AEVEVGLAAVVGDEHLAVLERVHRARVDVDVRVELLHRHPQASGLEEATEGRGGDALAQRRSDPTRYEDVFRHGITGYRGGSQAPGMDPQRARRAAASSSPACSRAVAERGEPDSILASSTTRVSSSRIVAVAVVPARPVVFVTATCVSA